jgi:hypothetical protein
VAVLLNWSSALTVKLKAVPLVAVDGADIAKWVAAAPTPQLSMCR